MRRTSKYFFVGFALVLALVIIFFSVSFLINAASNQINTFYVPQVIGTPNFSSPGSESFWGSVPSINVPLIDAVSYPGSPSGHTPTVSVKMAWTSSTTTPSLLILMKFTNYGPGPSYAPMSIPIVNNTANNQLLPMYNESCIYPTQSCYGGFYPQDTGFLPLAIGPQYVYPEQAIVLLGMHPGAGTDVWYQVSYKPKMVWGLSGALGTGTGGDSELWIWSSNPTDNASQDTGYPGIKYVNGSTLYPQAFGLPKNASYAIDGYANASSFYQMGGLPGSSVFPYINNGAFMTSNFSTIPANTPMMNPFEVQAKGAFAGNSWTVEYMRSLVTPSNGGENTTQLQMDPTNNTNYHIAFAVSQGYASQTYLIYYNSVSFWYGFNFVSPSGFNVQSILPKLSTGLLGNLMLAFFGLAYFARRQENQE